MTPLREALHRLREHRPPERAHPELVDAGVAFTTVGGPLERRWRQAVTTLADCLRVVDGEQVLLEGGGYDGTWLESTATAATDVLDRFAPSVVRATHLLLARHARTDGLLPYKVTAQGPAFTQIQMVTPLARGVWHHYLRTGDRDYLATMHAAAAAHDAWLARHRDTRGTGGVEAFCTFDTGHDLSPRFWGVPDRCLHGDAARYDDDVASLPFVAPDLTANVACQRRYLALSAAELGEDPEPWSRAAEASTEALLAQCFDPDAVAFYDRTADGALLRLDSDVLLRVLACEIGDAALAEAALGRHLLNRRRFLAAAGLTSVAMDDPRFDGDHTRNSWAGPVNMLTMLRAPAAFDHHGHVAELLAVERPLLGAMAGHDRFPQCLDPASGAPGFADAYAPAVLWLLDAVERTCGVLERPDGETWLTAVPPTRLDGGHAAAASGYARTVRGVRHELVADDTVAEVHRQGQPWLTFPRGWRVVLDGDGEPSAVVGVAPRAVTGRLRGAGVDVELTVEPNQRVVLATGERVDVGLVAQRS